MLGVIKQRLVAIDLLCKTMPHVGRRDYIVPILSGIAGHDCGRISSSRLSMRVEILGMLSFEVLKSLKRLSGA